MVRPNSAAQVIYDSSVTHGHVIRSHSRPSAEERHNFMSMNLIDMYQKPVPKESSEQLDSENEEMDMQKILKAVEYMGATTWKDRKALENQKVVALGGKPPKKHRTPLNVGRKVDMKRKKRKEEKKLEEDRILGRFPKHSSNDKRETKEKPESRVLKSSEGHFRNGVLNVKHLLKRPSSSRSTTVPLDVFGEGTKKGKVNKGKKGKGKGRKGKNGRH